MATAGSTCLPRFATPRDLRFPTRGPEVGEVARRLGRTFMPWQQDAADVAFEYDPVTGLFRYSEVVITIPRQSGKTIEVLAVQVHRTTVMARQLGPQRSTYTAQTRTAARRKLERDFGPMLAASKTFREVPHSRAKPTRATEYRLSLNNGSENILFGLGSYLQIDAPTETAGHGDTLDLGVIDEAFAQRDDRIEGAMSPAMATRRNAQLWVISTAGDENSFYLWRKVLAGRAATSAGEHGRVAYIEYSAPDDADPGDPATWWACMPALGHTVTEAFIAAEWDRAQRKGPEGIDTFRRAYLNQWPNPPILGEQNASTVVDLDAWSDLAVGTQRWDSETAPVLSVEIAKDRSSATIGAAWTVRGRPHLEVVEDRPGATWPLARCVDLRSRYRSGVVVLDMDTEARGLKEPLEAAGFDVVEVRSPQRVVACGDWFDRVGAADLSHAGDPAVAAAIGFARWKDTGDGSRVLTRKGSAGDIAALYAPLLALYGLTNSPATESDSYVL